MIRLLQKLLEARGYTREGQLTEKGRMLAHMVSKTVMEELPFPLICHESITNFREYADYQDRARDSMCRSNDAPEAVKKVSAEG